MSSTTPSAMVDKIMAFEDGQLSEPQIIEMMQEMLDSGLVWQLQGAYGRLAHRLLELGLIRPRSLH